MSQTLKKKPLTRRRDSNLTHNQTIHRLNTPCAFITIEPIQMTKKSKKSLQLPLKTIDFTHTKKQKNKKQQPHLAHNCHFVFNTT